jgi:uncharacterized membrane protein YkoI
MQTRADRIIATSIVVGIASFAAGCASLKPDGAAKEVDVTIAEVSAPARAAIETETAGGRVDKITREVERGKTVYDVEATVGGRHVEYLIDAGDGKLLGTEVPIEFSALPKPVQEATAKYFGTTGGLVMMKGVEYGETHYEIEGPKNGKTVEVTFDSRGKPAR